jgi:hypothetical protein
MAQGLDFVYIEKEIFRELDPEKIKRTFQPMKDQKMSLRPKWHRCSWSFGIGMFSYILPHLSLTH